MHSPLGRTLPDLLREKADERPDAIAIIAGGASVSYGDLLARAGRVASGLRRRGLARGDRVGLLAGNGVEWLEILFGCGLVGATVVPFSTWSTSRELSFLLGDAGIRLLFCTPGFGDRAFYPDIAGLVSTNGEGRSIDISASDVVCLDGQPFDGAKGYRSFLAVEEDTGGSFGMAADPGDDALVLYTSGSSSVPKAVRLIHAGLVENGFNIGERQGLGPDDRVFLSAPLFWAYGGANALPAAITHGAALVLAEKFTPESAIEIIEREGCTAIYTLPAMTGAILASPAFDVERLRTLRTGLTIGNPNEFLAAVDGLGVPELCNIYGSTETYGNCCVTWHHWPKQRRAQVQGPPLPGFTFRFRDPSNDEVVPDGREGLLEVKGHVSPGYSGASAIHNDVFTADGFYKTGDIGFLTKEGDFVFVGRNSEMIKRAGINVSPAEIENVLMSHPEVRQCAVVGVDDAERGERVVAYVVPDAAVHMRADDLQAHCAAELSKYKLPDHIEVVDTLPLTTTGKLHRRQLKDQAAHLIRSSDRIRA